MTVTKVLRNASIRTMKGDNSIEQAIAFRDGSILSVGITRVCDPTVNRTLERIYQQAWEQDRLCLPVLMQPISGKGHFCPPGIGWTLARLPAKDPSMFGSVI